MKSLYLNKNNITKVSFLANINIILTDISLQNNCITDISILDRFKHLRILLLSNNQITSLKGLANLEKIEYLYINGNPITLDGLEYISEICYREMLIELHIDRKVFKEYGTKFALYPEYLQWVDRIYFVENDGSVAEWYNY
ncbi:MAG: leucine-rich repeat domain-containing protein [Firmicutes bacterium]|nr:leucine-rich repeat domain-containing protein [Bacillota bacterium]